MSKQTTRNERLLRKRVAARLRQQRCRARKRMALLKEEGKHVKATVKACRNHKRVMLSSPMHYPIQTRVATYAPVVYRHYFHTKRIPENPMSSRFENIAAAVPRHFHASARQYPIKNAPYLPPAQKQFNSLHYKQTQKSPEAMAIDAMLALKRTPSPINSPCRANTLMQHHSAGSGCYLYVRP